MIRKLFCHKKIGECSRPKPLRITILAFLIDNKDKVIYQKDLENEFKISKAAISDVLNGNGTGSAGTAHKKKTIRNVHKKKR